jgi:hypothetical protein
MAAEDEHTPDREDAARTAPPPRIDRNPRAVLGWLVVAAVLWGLSYLVPVRTPTGTVAQLWLGFAAAMVRDTLRLLGILSVGLASAAAGFRLATRIERRFWTCPRAPLLVGLAILAVASSAWFAYGPLDHMPHVQDEIAILFQAKNLARGQLYAPAPPAELEPFFGAEFLVTDDGRWYGKYFALPSLVLVPGIWLGVPWLINPLLAGLAIPLFYALGRELFGEKMGRLAALLGVLSIFRMSTFAMMLSHGVCLVLATLFAWMLIRAARRGDCHRSWLIAGVALGGMIHARPFTAVAMAIPLGIAAAVFCAGRRLRPTALLAFVLPVVVAVALLLAYNRGVTGDALTTPFKKWSSFDRIGFGPDVGMEYWPQANRGHTIGDAFRNTYFDLDELSVYLLGWGRGVLVLMAAAFLVRGHRARHLLSLSVWLALVAAYFAYHSPGTLAGQARYWSEALAFILLLVAGGLTATRILLADLLRRLGGRAPDPRARAALGSAGVLLTIGAVAVFVPRLVHAEIGDAFFGRSDAIPRALAGQPLANAIVLVPGRYDHDERYDVGPFEAGPAFNDPNLTADVLFARDWGAERNRPLYRHFPHRRFYRLVRALEGAPHFEPVAPAETSGPATQPSTTPAP